MPAMHGRDSSAGMMPSVRDQQAAASRACLNRDCGVFRAPLIREPCFFGPMRRVEAREMECGVAICPSSFCKT